MENETQKTSDKWLPISIIIAAVLIGGSVLYSNGLGGASDPMQAGDTQVKGNKITSPEIGDDVVLGDPNAKVTIYVFGDYQCPFCKRMFDDAEEKIRNEYIQAGKVNMVYKDFPLSNIHPYAQAAAEAAECAKDQGKYWAYHDLLFERQEQIPSQNFVGWAQELGLDTNQYKECFDSGKYRDEVLGDLNEGLDLGVNGTPGTFVNDEFISGAQPYSVFQQAIEEALAGN